MTAVYRSKHGSFSWVKQPSSKAALSNASPPTFTTTADGAAGGTTALSGTLGGASNAAWVGNIVECVKATNTANLGCRAMVKAFDYLTGALTFDAALPAQVKSGDGFRMYTTPDAPVVATSAVTGGATVVATGRTEADDYWNGTAQQGGYYLEAVHGANISAAQHPLISDFVAATDTFTPATSFGVNIAIGDFLRCVRHPQVEGVVMIPPERSDLPRDLLVAGYGTEPGAQGNNGGGGAVSLLLAGPGIGREGLAAEADEALSCVLTASAGTAGVVTDAGSSVSSVTYDAGSPEVGDIFVTTEGDAFMVTVDSGSALTPFPTLRSAPVANQTLVGARKYVPANTLAAALTVYNWKGSAVQDIFYGVVPLPTLSFERGQHAKLALELRAADFYRASGDRSWYTRRGTVDSMRTRDGRLALMAGSTLVDLPFLGGTFDPQIEVKDLPNLTSPNETDGFEIVNVGGSGTFRTRLNATTMRLIRDCEGKRELGLLMQSGAAPGTLTVGVIAYSVVLGATLPIEDDANELVATVPFTVHRNEVGLGLGLPLFSLFMA